MRYQIFIFLLTLLFIYSCLSKADDTVSTNNSKASSIVNKDTSLNGSYVGLQEHCRTDSFGKKDCYSDPGRPERKWYHYSYLKLKDDSVFLDQSPISIGRKNDTLWSASDGAFYYYHGTISKSDTSAKMDLKLIFCDYCAIPTQDNPRAYLFPSEKLFHAKITKAGLLINGYLFRKSNRREKLISESRRLSSNDLYD
jgi:hypothetical protein